MKTMKKNSGEEFVFICFCCNQYFVFIRRKNEINQIADETEEVEDIKEIIDDDTDADGTYKH